MGGSNINIFFIIIICAIAFKCFPVSKELKLWMGYSKLSVLNFTEAVAEKNYNAEEHNILTEDGYILTIFRIASRNCHTKKDRPVLLMHGLFQNSDTFLDAGPNAGLPYLLSDECYDVWVGNQRGNNYARKHLRLNPDRDTDFWQFSVDEIGFYDVPATIDYILKNTDIDKISYVGFSQGCGVFFAMCSERPDYCDKTAVMIALAPAVILKHTESWTLGVILHTAKFFKRYFEFLGAQEFFYKGSFSQEILEFLCQWSWTERLCVTHGFLDNFHPDSVTVDAQKLIFSHCFMGTSLNNLVQYAQMAGTENFNKMDYGESINLKRYNSTEAPPYKIDNVSVPVVLIQGKNDKMVNVKDVETLAVKLPNVLEMMQVINPKWTHFDMVYNSDIKRMIFPKINEYLLKYSKRDN